MWDILDPMNTPFPRPKLTSDQRRALAFLAQSTDGCPEALTLAHGFPDALLTNLIGIGFITTESRAIRAGGRVVLMQRLRITEAGRQAL
jgi:hypothetical protein